MASRGGQTPQIRSLARGAIKKTVIVPTKVSPIGPPLDFSVAVYRLSPFRVISSIPGIHEAAFGMSITTSQVSLRLAGTDDTISIFNQASFHPELLKWPALVRDGRTPRPYLSCIPRSLVSRLAGQLRL